ncbi:nuclear receptor coactivator 1 isoform X2 [Neodiprion virginianus]|uniref:nuclear receptor coactivator 1 isoform X2 n=1 Tax=Neodiprion virginianus TaxID=2961670 RepID=UPI001EE72CB2|nr:nuclear receptor coactivator 1 isoform X2 [Neodiprion virginianus]
MSIAAAENAGPGPCDLQDPGWVKMSVVNGNNTKKRKKSDAKPQSQLNKCLNEKRRRTQENLYIDELAELISAQDMSSGKTDKCQILQRTVDQIRHIRQQEGSNSHAVQQGEVSSSNPNILSNDQVGPILLEALDGFLFVVNAEGRVEYVTDNISQYISYTKDDVFGKDIYNIIHHGDHKTFMASLLPMSIGLTSEPQPQTRNRTFNCRFLVKPPDDKEETMEEKQQRISKYETMQICSALLPNNADRLESGDVSSESLDGPCMMCVARRIPHSEKPITSIKQFTVKLDTIGRIIWIDNSGLSPAYSKYIGKDLIGTKIQDLCHPLDVNKLNAHLDNTLHTHEGTSTIYRLRVKADKFLNVQTKSRLFKANVINGHESDFLMATHSIIGDNELTPNEGGQLSNSKTCSGHSSNHCTNSSNNNNGNNNNNVGGPLMTGAHHNGQSSGNTGRGLAAARAPTSSSSSNLNVFSANDTSSCNPLTSMSTTSNSFNQFSGNMELDFELFPSTTWELDSGHSWGDRSDSRASGPTNSRPPSQPAPASPSPQGSFSVNSATGATSHCSSMRAYSPTSVHTSRSFSNSFSFSPLQETQTAVTGTPSSANTNGGGGVLANKRLEESKGCPPATPANVDTNKSQHSAAPAPDTQNCAVSTESGRLRNLLTKGASTSDENQDNTNNTVSDNQNKHRILKTLLKETDDEDLHLDIDNKKVRPSNSGISKSSTDHSKTSSGNNMLLELLNDKNDDDDLETRAGLKKRHELLQQLLKDEDEEGKNHDSQNRGDDPLLKSLGFNNPTPPLSQSGNHVGQLQVGQKRPGENGDEDLAAKRTMDRLHQVTSSGNNSSSNASTSKLWEKNKMLAWLLAQQPSEPKTKPSVPLHELSAIPQEKLARKQVAQQSSWPNAQPVGSNPSTKTTTPIQSQPRLPRNPTNIYDVFNQPQRPQVGSLNPEFGTAGGENRRSVQVEQTWLEPSGSDPILSDLLDQVIEIVPDTITDIIESPQNNAVDEKIAAINAIHKSLILCETAVNPTSSTITMPGTPPAYSTTLGNTPVTTGHNYQPPPMYQQQQQRARFNSAQQNAVRQSSVQFSQQHLQLQQRTKQLQQQQQQQQQQQLKQRLLQQQQQQQLLIPSNATATDQLPTDIHNIDSLLNNTVAPNVSLQRSSVSDSQVSPGYGGISVQLPSTHRLTHSYSHPSTLPQHSVVNTNFNNGQQGSAAARLSPHSPANILSFSHPQSLSPRVTQGNYGNGPRMFVNSVRPQPQQSVSQQQQQRSMPSPGTPASARQSPFPADTFPPPAASPTAGQFPPVPNAGAANPSGQYRLQRTTSTPSATTQLPGGINSPRHYGGMNKEQPLLSPSHPHSGCPSQPSLNQHNVTNTQHLSNQHPAMIYHSNTTLNSTEVQNNQFCYDRASVSLYSSGPGDTSNTRPLPPGNPNSHQMGGNAGSGGTMTEFVRQELRAIVGARTQQQQQQQRIPNNIQNNLSGQVSAEDLDALGLTYEMSSAGEAVVSDGPAKSWAIGSAGSAPSSSRTTMEEVARGDPKSSLLQKLLSE